MASHICSIVPPYLLRAIVESNHEEVDEETRQGAQCALEHHEHLADTRHGRFAALSQPRALRAHRGIPGGQRNSNLLQHIAECEDVDKETRDRARRDLAHLISAHSAALTLERGTEKETGAVAAAEPEHQPSGFYRAVYDAKNNTDEEELPGQLLRVEGQRTVEDRVTNEAYDNVGKVLHFYREVFDWESIDNRNMPVHSSVHFGQAYGNAFWDPNRMQMVFGSGNKFLDHFTGCLDVIGHELSVRIDLVLAA